MIRPLLVRALPGYRLYLEFSDGAHREIDLSYLARKPVFERWAEYNFFEQVSIGDHREVKWKDDIELCADALYLKLTGKSPEDLFPKLRKKSC